MKTITGKFNTAKVFATTVEDACTEQVKSLCDESWTAGSKIRIMPDCLTEDAEVLTRTGFKRICELNVHDDVANYDETTSLIFFSHPKSIVIREKRPDEKVYAFYNKQNGIKFTVSENHRMVVKDNFGILAKDLRETKTCDFVYAASGLNARDICTKYSDDDIRLIAWIVGDGNITRNNTKESLTARIRFGLRKERKIKRLSEILRSLGVCPNISVSTKQTSIYINTFDSKRFIDIVGFDKHYPLDFLFLSNEQYSVLKDELIQIDGNYESYTKNGSYRLNSSRKTDTDFFSALGSIHGNMTRCVEHTRKSGYPTNNKSMFYCNMITEDTLRYSKSGYHSRPFSKDEIEYSGKMVCIECDTGYFLARQNGTSFVTGNCHAGKGCVVGTTMTITDKVVPSLVGVDIGCGMLTVQFRSLGFDLAKLDAFIKENIPLGMRRNNQGQSDRIMNDVESFVSEFFEIDESLDEPNEEFVIK